MTTLRPLPSKRRTGKTASDVIGLLRRRVHSAFELRALLQISQPTLSRLLNSMDSSLLVIGKARQTRYALRRQVRGIGSDINVYRVSPQAEVQLAGVLIALCAGGFVWRDALTKQDHVFDSLPYFLWDIRPQGFLAKINRPLFEALQLPAQIASWGDDDMLAALSCGINLAGNLIFGSERLQAHIDNVLALEPRIDTAQDAIDFFDFVTNHHSTDTVYSSAAGEQPKFAVGSHDQLGVISELIVKYSPPTETASGRRWADLLICEHLALRILSDVGQDVAVSRIEMYRDRVFLALERFDRTHNFGRIGLVSLKAVNAEFVGGREESWAEAGAQLLQLGKITPTQLTSIQQREAFGYWIANGDMHFGNLSFYLADDFGLSLAPVYDMLPMYYAPNIQGEIISRAWHIPPMPTHLQLVWLQAKSWAITYWQAVSCHPMISQDMRDIAGQMLAVLQADVA